MSGSPQERHRNRVQIGFMTSERDSQERRTRAVRRSVVALGATGALGAAGAIGFGIAAAQSTVAPTGSSASQDQDRARAGQHEDLDDRDLRDQDLRDQELRDQGLGDPGGQPPLASPGNGEPAQGSTGGS